MVICVDDSEMFEEDSAIEQEEPEPVVIPMDIVEAEYTIQGEGIFVGTPSLILRMANCNKKCIWCDVKKKRIDRKYNMNSIVRVLAEYVDVDLVITGGEPLVQLDALGYIINTAIAMKSMRNTHSRIIVETNGSISPNDMKWAIRFEESRLTDEAINRVFWSVSPKLHSSAEEWRTTKFQDFLKLPNIQFKFTINPFDLDDIIDLKSILCLMPPEIPVVVQSVTAFEDYDHEGYQRSLNELCDIVLKSRYPQIRLIPQVQKVIWGLARESI